MVFHHVHPNPNQITVLVVSASTFFIMYNPTQTPKPNQTTLLVVSASKFFIIYTPHQTKPKQTTVLVVSASRFFIMYNPNQTKLLCLQSVSAHFSSLHPKPNQNKPNYCNCSQCQQVFNHVQPKPNYCACSQLQHVFHVKPKSNQTKSLHLQSVPAGFSLAMVRRTLIY